MDETESKSLAYSDLVKEIERLKGLIECYYNGDPSLPLDFNYKKSIQQLQYLRNKQKSVKKVEKVKYEKEE